MSGIPPDVTAFDLSTARQMLAAAGWTSVQVIETRPPRAGRGLGDPRIARQRATAEGEIELVVVYAEYERSARGGRVRDTNPAR